MQATPWQPRLPRSLRSPAITDRYIDMSSLIRHAAVQDEGQNRFQSVDNMQRVGLREDFPGVNSGGDANAIDLRIARHLEIKTTITNYHDIVRRLREFVDYVVDGLRMRFVIGHILRSHQQAEVI